jgi:hypothetical protein
MYSLQKVKIFLKQLHRSVLRYTKHFRIFLLNNNSHLEQELGAKYDSSNLSYGLL